MDTAIACLLGFILIAIFVGVVWANVSYYRAPKPSAEEEARQKDEFQTYSF